MEELTGYVERLLLATHQQQERLCLLVETLAEQLRVANVVAMMTANPTAGELHDAEVWVARLQAMHGKEHA